MSNSILTVPVPPNGGFALPITRTPRYSTIKQDTASQRGQTRISLSPYPVWDIEFSTAYVTGSEAAASAYQSLLGFYMQMKGSFDDFLVAMPGDSSVPTPVSFGTGDASTVSFQLTRPIAGGLDIIQNLNGAPSIFVNGTLQATTAFGVSNTGILTFTSAPAALATLTWSGNFYYRVHFVDDSLQLQCIGKQLFSIQPLKLESVILP